MQEKEAEVRNAIAHQSALEKDRLRQSMANQGDAVIGPGLPEDAPGLAGELNAIEGAKRYAHSLQVSSVLLAIHACHATAMPYMHVMSHSTPMLYQHHCP